MKNYLFKIIAVLSFIYLLGCFVSASFNISNWNLGLRVVIAALAFASIFVFIDYSEKN